MKVKYNSRHYTDMGFFSRAIIKYKFAVGTRPFLHFRSLHCPTKLYPKKYRIALYLRLHHLFNLDPLFFTECKVFYGTRFLDLSVGGPSGRCEALVLVLTEPREFPMTYKEIEEYNTISSLLKI